MFLVFLSRLSPNFLPVSRLNSFERPSGRQNPNAPNLPCEGVTESILPRGGPNHQMGLVGIVKGLSRPRNGRNRFAIDIETHPTGRRIHHSDQMMPPSVTHPVDMTSGDLKLLGPIIPHAKGPRSARGLEQDEIALRANVVLGDDSHVGGGVGGIDPGGDGELVQLRL